MGMVDIYFIHLINTFFLMSVESEGVGRDLRTSLLCGLEEVQAEVRQLRTVVDTSMESIAHQLVAQSTKEVSPKFLISRSFIYLTDIECWNC